MPRKVGTSIEINHSYSENSHLESVGPAATTGLLELATLGAHVRLHTVVGVQVVHAESRARMIESKIETVCENHEWT